VWIVCNRQTVALGNWERHSVALPATMPSERTSWPAPAPRIDRAPNPDHRSGFSSFCSEAVRSFRSIFSGGIQVERGAPASAGDVRAGVMADASIKRFGRGSGHGHVRNQGSPQQLAV
jgi:hypothetical protein